MKSLWLGIQEMFLKVVGMILFLEIKYWFSFACVSEHSINSNR